MIDDLAADLGHEILRRQAVECLDQWSLRLSNSHSGDRTTVEVQQCGSSPASPAAQILDSF